MDRVGLSRKEIKGKKVEWLSLPQLASKSVTCNQLYLYSIMITKLSLYM